MLRLYTYRAVYPNTFQDSIHHHIFYACFLLASSTHLQCYMCAANLTQPLDNHVDIMAAFGQSLITIASQEITPLGTPMAMRVGLNTGPVIAGLLGFNRYKYTVVSAALLNV